MAIAPHGSSSHRHRPRRPPPPRLVHQSPALRLLVSLLLLLVGSNNSVAAHAHASASSFIPGAEAAKQKGGLFHCAWQFETSHARCNMGIVDKTVRSDNASLITQSGLSIRFGDHALPSPLPPPTPRHQHPHTLHTHTTSRQNQNQARYAGWPIFPNHRVYKLQGRFPTDGVYYALTVRRWSVGFCFCYK